MSRVHSVSVAAPPGRNLPRLMFEAARRAEAMGIIDPSQVTSDAAGVRQLANRIRRAGVAASAADLLNNVEVPSGDELVAILHTIIAALDASPVPEYEWGGLGRVFAPEDL